MNWLKVFMQLFTSGNIDRVLTDVKQVTSAVEDLTNVINSGGNFGQIMKDVNIIVTAVEDLVSLLKQNPQLAQTLTSLMGQ
jgi:hypothetical protein